MKQLLANELLSVNRKWRRFKFIMGYNPVSMMNTATFLELMENMYGGK